MGAMAMTFRSFIFIALVNLCCAADTFTPHDWFLYGRQFGPLVVEATVIAIDEKKAGKPALLLGHPARSEWASQNIYFTVNTMPKEGSFRFPPRYLQPSLRIGERGYWTVMGMTGSAQVLYEPAFGRLWPVIEGRDEEFPEVKAWADLMAESEERRSDYEGKKWPAPPPKAKPAPPKPPGFVEKLLTSERSAPPDKRSPRSVEPRGIHAVWPWLVGIAAALGFGMFLGMGIASKKREGGGRGC